FEYLTSIIRLGCFGMAVINIVGMVCDEKGRIQRRKKCRRFSIGQFCGRRRMQAFIGLCIGYSFGFLNTGGAHTEVVPGASSVRVECGPTASPNASAGPTSP